MKKFLPSTLLLVLSVLFTFSINAQVSIKSTTGYTVTIDLKPVGVVTYTNNCQWGYTWNIRMNYQIKFTGTNIPSSMYTLSGTVGCGSTTMTYDLPDNGGSGTTITYESPWSTSSDCSTVKLSDKTCGTTSVVIEGPGIALRTVPVSSPIILSVRMAEFNASIAFSKVSLTWATASEQNNDHFTIERSVNGTNWSAIGTVKGAMNSTTNTNYAFTDASPVNGVSYYRIRQTDFDGQSTVSEIRTINNNAASKSISLYPVPNNGNNITVTGIRDYSNFQLNVINANGASVYNTTLKSSSVELPKLTAGFYFIRITDKNTGDVTNIRYIKN